MICGTLQQLVESGKITIPQIAQAWHIEHGSVYPYLNDREPRFSQLRRLIEAADPEAAEAILDCLMASTGWVATYIEASLDIDGDGDVDTDDAVQAVITQAAAFSKLLKAVHDNSKTQRITHEAAEHVLHSANELIRGAMIATLITSRLRAKQTKRYLTAGGHR